jgi:hypothetical protein
MAAGPASDTSCRWGRSVVSVAVTMPGADELDDDSLELVGTDPVVGAHAAWPMA